ncbi:LON peptidase substrate-binding domain-containing protein [Thalassomonas actiniarum]|uniref:Lon N-terminal domain-containing protein n=1 Tax=Thalassomonas actiniarum TaxID=485447 RepID=A0AAF0C454_9GAMM|nr:LON peptidase substrate-binding domain-containing protein [Thalassomonas actiniarum]WDE00268.1 hypothetical protein SG35_006355 [Thalassomonas actiniarum]
MKLPIFPLPVFMLPQGMTRLKIFEPRYLKMVKIGSKENGFAILLDPWHGDSMPVASWVEIINFGTGDDGFLLLDVRCKGLVAISAAYRDQDNLMWASIAPLEHWPEHRHDQLTRVFSQLLQAFFMQSEGLTGLYSGSFIDQPNWVLARWLELLPVANQHKVHFLKASSYDSALLLLSMILSENNLRLSDLK